MPERLVAALVLVAILLLIAGAFLAYRVMRMPQWSSSSSAGPLDGPQLAIREDLVRDVSALASFGERNAMNIAGLRSAASFARTSMEQAGFDAETQPFQVGNVDYENVFAVLPGTSHANEIVVIGAHYDTVFDSPGADDNASGVAGLLAVMRALRGHPQARTIHFVAFVNEEPPFFRSHDMGSYHYAQRLHANGAKVTAMVSIESIGFFSSKAGSQRYPPPLDRFFPSTADFIGVVGDLGSRELTARCSRTLAQAGVSVEAAALPSVIQEAAWSDHWSFREFGFPAVMITDTALFRNPNYHTPHDLPETLDYDQMTCVVSGLVEVVRDLASTSP